MINKTRFTIRGAVPSEMVCAESRVSATPLPPHWGQIIGWYSIDGRPELEAWHHLQETYINRQNPLYLGLAT